MKTANALNALHVGQIKHIKTVQSAWSNDSYEEIPFSCDPKLTDEQLQTRLAQAIYKKFPPRHFAGCGTSTELKEVHRETPNSGKVLIMTYQGIGD